MRAGIAIALCALLLAAGCGESGRSLIEKDGLRLVVAGTQNGGMSASIPGKIALTSGDCLGLELGGQTRLVVWPHGTKFAKSGRGVDLPGLGEVQLGEPIRAGGGEVSYQADDEAAGTFDFPEDCLAKDRKYYLLHKEGLRRGIG